MWGRRLPELRTALLPHLPALTLLLALTGYELWPMLARWDTYGFHDWDVATAQRYLTVLSLRRYGEAPWWNPYFCGGFPGFGHPEGTPNLVSPWLPLYLLADLRIAIRIEVLGSALLGVIGSYVLAGRFTKSTALRAWVAILFALSGRFSLQAAVGHTWHLAYAYLPWALWFFDRALEPKRFANVIGTGALLALMAYVGGIYPLPHTALVLSLYALGRAVLGRTRAPLVALAASAAVGVGLAMPKLAAVADAMRRAPRLIESTEMIGWRQLWIMMTSRVQEYGKWPMHVPRYNWHEWGLYVGPVGAIALFAGLWARDRKQKALVATALVLLALGFGDFHRLAPWPLLHRLPVFSSQHVPSRFFYPMLLVAGLAAVAALGRFIDPRLPRWRRLDLGLLGAVALYGADVTHIASRAFEQSFWMQAPERIERLSLFEHQLAATLQYQRADWATPMYLAMRANTGVIQCYGLDPSFKEIGARPVGAEDYRGRAFVEDGGGSTEVLGWSPNRVRIRVSGAPDGARVVYNMNWDPSWRAGSRAADDDSNALATSVSGGSSVVVFSYFPRTLRWSLPLAALTLVVCGWTLARKRERSQAE